MFLSKSSSSIFLKALFRKNGVRNVVSNAMITSMEYMDVSISPFCNAMFAITSSMIPLALRPNPSATDFGPEKPANLPPT